MASLEGEHISTHDGFSIFWSGTLILKGFHNSLNVGVIVTSFRYSSPFVYDFLFVGSRDGKICKSCLAIILSMCCSRKISTYFLDPLKNDPVHMKRPRHKTCPKRPLL